LQVIQDALVDERVALKGGTAINLFLEDMPRLSVDIDLCYLPLESRELSLIEIDKIVEDIALRISRKSRMLTQINKSQGGYAKQIFVQKERASIKIQINHVLRGHVYETQILPLCSKAQEKYKTYVEIRCLSTEDIYGGKLCAALDRQHPRDLFDVRNFFKKHQFTEKFKQAFIVSLISTNRPISELLQPNLLDQKSLYEREFKGMTDSPITYETLQEARDHLILTLARSLNKQDQEFLISFKRKAPLWDYFSVDHIREMPTIRWKLHNINQMESAKHREALEKLFQTLISFKD